MCVLCSREETPVAQREALDGGGGVEGIAGHMILDWGGEITRQKEGP